MISLLACLALLGPAESLQRGVHFLVTSQNANGSWGDKRGALPVDMLGSNQGNHDLFQRATTALCCLALQEAGKSPQDRAALRKGIDFLLAGGPSKRPSDWEVYNTWSYIYALQAFARIHGDPAWKDSGLQEKLRRAGEAEIEALSRYQTPDGGWGYYDFDTLAQRPSWATSFSTAAAVLALLEAKAQGFRVEDKMLRRAVKAVAHCRLPSGAYTYSVNPITSPGGPEWIDRVKGSLGRIQVGNVALHLAGENLTVADLQRGIETFFEHHKFLAVAVMRPIPHEAYYYNSGYFYFFGHHYGAMAIEKLPEPSRRRFWPKLQEAIVQHQAQDGSFRDWFLNDYAKPYATAYAVMAMQRSLR